MIPRPVSIMQWRAVKEEEAAAAAATGQGHRTMAAMLKCLLLSRIAPSWSGEV